MYPFFFLAMILSLMFLVGSVYADDKAKGPSCQDQLNDASVLAHNLATDRNQKEKTLANAQVMIMQLRQRNEQLEKQVTEMQKAIAPKKE
jgi:hypothetical protein